ncbi:CDP-alcohol phosphatidyltransferase family protein [Moritella yayanosii]|uniref:CDP-alcohol phosphatidyltransferase n=1 Tax=Moritella yayanosii TaxID=69539 RepID=A0A330LPB7_9GAMM|nr:CDP-alcohol phosphatidyltransferase family protein [Moritella yayanosii]SQD78834.1 Conserved in MT-2, not other S or M, conserved membrane protein of unknown function [Moritella yayanosii]
MNVKLKKLWATKTKDDEWWSSFVTSPLAILLNYFVVDIKWLTPNKITLISFITAIIASILIVIGGLNNFIIAAILINLSHIFDCMDGQMARYRKTTSASGSYYDKLTDQIQVTLWFGAVGYAAYAQSGSVLPILLSLIGIAFYSLRGYAKYIYIYTNMTLNNNYLEEIVTNTPRKDDVAGIEFSVIHNLRWFIGEQKKIIFFNEGVFIFMLSFSLILNILTPMLWLFAISQVFYSLYRGLQRGLQLENNTPEDIQK